MTKVYDHDITEMADHKKNPMGDYKIRRRGPRRASDVLEDLSATNAVVGAKATPEEAQGWRAWMVAVAQAAADAAKEGGFMGFGAELVSQGERDMMTRVAKAVGASK